MAEPEQLRLLDLPGDDWWEVPYGDDDKQHGFVRCRAATREEAKAIATEQLRDVGVLPGPMHAAWKRFVKATS